MPFTYRGKVISKELWDKMGDKLKSKVAKEGIFMKDTIDGIYVVKDQYGIEVNSKRLMVLMRIEVKHKSTFYCYATCKDFNMQSVTPVDFQIEFLKNTDWNQFQYPYDKELFEGIYDMATEIFLEIKENEKTKSMAV